MLEINEQNHTGVLLSSLDKIYNKGRLNGKLNSINLYILNIIYKLLDNCCIELTQENKIQLMDLYRKIYYNSETICKVSNIKKYNIPVKLHFEQAETEDCNVYPKVNKIFYWQEESYINTVVVILDMIGNDDFFTLKSNDSLISFENGKLIEYNNIGRICFAITESDENEVFKIYDILNNDITHSFNTEYYTVKNCRLFISNNIYSHGDINFKIKKI